MSGTRAFASLNITVESKAFVGPKISIDHILSHEITVHDYKIDDSKFGAPGTKRLFLQISFNNVKYVVFTNSGKLKEQIQKAGPDSLPFATTIVKKEDKSFLFT